MKKIWCVCLAIAILCIPATAFAAEPAQTRLLVTGYTLNPDPIEAGGEAVLTLTLENTSSRYLTQNIVVKLAFEDEALRVQGSGLATVEPIPKGESREVSFTLQAAPDAPDGLHGATVTLEYEDYRAIPYTGQTALRLDVHQKGSLGHNAPETQAVAPTGTAVFQLEVYNTGREELANVRAELTAEIVAFSQVEYLGTLASGEVRQVELDGELVQTLKEEMTDASVWEGLSSQDETPVKEFPGTIRLTGETRRGEVVTVSVPCTLIVNYLKPASEVYTAPETQAGDEGLNFTGWAVAGAALLACLVMGGILFAQNQRARRRR